MGIVWLQVPVLGFWTIITERKLPQFRFCFFFKNLLLHRNHRSPGSALKRFSFFVTWVTWDLNWVIAQYKSICTYPSAFGRGPNCFWSDRGSSLYEFRDAWFGPQVHILASCLLELNQVIPRTKYLNVLLLGEGAKWRWCGMDLAPGQDIQISGLNIYFSVNIQFWFWDFPPNSYRLNAGLELVDPALNDLSCW